MKSDLATLRSGAAQVIALTAAAILCIYPATFASAQSISGRVTERQSGASVRGAGVVLINKDGRAQMAAYADSSGKYSIAAPQAGVYTLAVSGRGLVRFVTEAVDLRVGSESKLDVALSLGPTRLDTVVVTGKPVVDRSLANPHKYDEFILRRNLGIGTFLTREQIEAKPTAQTLSIFSTIPGLKVRQHGTEWFIQSQRCPGQFGGGRGSGSRSRRGSGRMDYDDPNLWPALFIDGFKVIGLATLNTISPSQIEAIEVYQGVAQLPAVAKGNSCAAIFVWLKSGK